MRSFECYPLPDKIISHKYYKRRALIGIRIWELDNWTQNLPVLGPNLLAHVNVILFVKRINILHSFENVHLYLYTVYILIQYTFWLAFTFRLD